MSLVDLKSDLSKFRQTVSKEEKDSPASSKATDVNNFATLQPISDRLAQLRPSIGEWKTAPIESLLGNSKLDDIKKPNSNFTALETKLGQTKLDDIKRTPIKNILINSVSKLSPVNTEFDTNSILDVYEEDVISQIAKLRKEKFESRLNKSDIEIKPFSITETQFSSNIEVNIPEQSFDRSESSPAVSKNNESTNNVTDPKIKINVPEQSFDRKSQSPILNSKGLILPNDDVVNPNIDVSNRPALFNDLSGQSVVINKDLLSPLNNVIDPEISLQRSELFFDRTDQSPEIDTETEISGLVTDPKIKIIKSDLSTNQEKDNSDLNINGKITRYVPISRLATMSTDQIVDTVRYDLASNQERDNSELNVDDVIRTNPSGRNEDPSKSDYSINGTQEVNFFKNINATGFTANADLLETEYKAGSQYVWTGKNIPSVNFIQDKNAVGFKTFVESLRTLYLPNTSQFGFDDIPETDFLDIPKKFTISGFKSFSKQYESDYRRDSSEFTWIGKRSASPEVNYFDISKTYTKAGFHKFAGIYDTKYNTDSSIFNWDGKRESAPVVNYFDIKKNYTKAGFHKFARLYDTKYIPESSIYDWDGDSQDAPAVNYFDLVSKFTTAGFHIFAPFLETMYIPDSSRFDWDGVREQAPFVNYFDVSSKFTTAGFQTFAPFLETKYIPDSSVFDWNGPRLLAPEVNYFDISNQYTNAGFHKFASLLDSKYIPESSVYDWDGARVDAPNINYFDLISRFTSEGFHTFAQLYDTKYIPDSSDFDWDGLRLDAPVVDYFDLTKKHTTDGFHKFAALLDTKYVPESSVYDWDGSKQDAPAINYFDLIKQHTTIGFHTFAQLYDTKYIPEASIFDWNGFRSAAPFVNYFDLSSVKKTTAGFHTFAQLYDTKYVPESSIFDWDGKRIDAPVVDYFDLTKKNTTIGFHKFAALYDTKYVPESSVFDWDGARSAAPFVDYFDLTTTKKTTAGFHTFAQLYDTKYVPESSQFDWDGSPRTSLENFVDYFANTNATGFTKFAIPLVTEYVKESSRFDWDGLPKTSLENFVDYFPNGNATGFTKFAIPLVTEYVPESSRFDWDGSPRTSLENFVDYFPNGNAPGFTKFAIPLVTEYVKESSNFDWDGVRTAAPAVDYFDLTKKNTTAGFHTLAQLYDTKYTPESSDFDWDGLRNVAPAVNYFDLTNKNTTDGFHTFATLYDTKYIPESSIYDWDGNKISAPAVNYFSNTNANGFSTFSRLLQTFYKKDSSVFDWNGIRKDAPEVSFFNPLVRPNTSPVVITNLGGLTTATLKIGFKKFFIDKTKTDLRSDFSFYSTENGSNKSKINGIPLTNFFGFKPEIRNGFMPQMIGQEETLYPIINPQLKYDFNTSDRLFMKIFRAAGGLALKDREDYAPNGLGKKLWTSGNSTVFASLTNQVPESKIKAQPSYYGNPYAKTMKDVTEGKGYLAKWAITKNSPSPLDQQYSKYNLQKDAYESGFVGDQPFVVRDIGQKWGFGTTFDEGLIRGGATTMAERAVYDAQRIGKWLISTKGLLWNVKQVGLQLMNPNVDTDPQGGVLGAVADFITTFGMSPTQIFNPLATIVNVAGSAIGLRVPRHSLLGAIDSRSLNKYETSTINRELASPPNDTVVNYFKELEVPTSDGQQTKYSRLIGLMRELLPNSFRTLEPNNVQSSDYLGHSKIYRISTWFGGPNAPLGIGGTKIRRARHPYLTYYTTDGNLPAGFAGSTFPAPLPGANTFGSALAFLGSSTFNAGSTNPAYPDTARRTQFYNIYDSTGEIPNTYTDVIMRNYNENGRKIFGDIRGLSALFIEGPTDPNQAPSGIVSSSLPNETLGRIIGMNPFKPTRKSLSANLNRVTAFNAEGLNLDGIEGYSLINNDGSPIKKYLTATYSNLRRRSRDERYDLFTESFSRRYNDFRFDVYEREVDGFDVSTYVSDPDVMGGYYKKRNLENYFGIGREGEPGAERRNVGKSNVIYNKDATVNASYPVLKTGREFRGDRINILDYKRSTAALTTDLVYEKGAYNNTSIPGKSDLIEFYFSGVNLTATDSDRVEIIPFRATFGNISDSHNPKWNPIKYMGRGDPLYVYDGYERSISFDFVVHIGSRDEMKASWRKLNYLASWTAPEYTAAGLIKGPLIRLNIGHLYRKLPGFINSLSYTFDNTQTTWETAHLDHDRQNIADAFEDGYPDNYSTPGALQLPKHIAVSVGYTPVGVYRPEYNGIMYQLYDDTGTTPETGLMPDIDDKVNYIKMYDDKVITDADNTSEFKVVPGDENVVPAVDPSLRRDVNDSANTAGIIVR